jgi:hypothetical protein
MRSHAAAREVLLWLLGLFFLLHLAGASLVTRVFAGEALDPIEWARGAILNATLPTRGPAVA